MCPRLPTDLTSVHFAQCPNESSNSIMGWLDVYFGNHPDFEDIYHRLLQIDETRAQSVDSMDMFRWASPDEQFDIWKIVVLQEGSYGDRVQGNQGRGSSALDYRTLRCVHGEGEQRQDCED